MLIMYGLYWVYTSFHPTNTVKNPI